MSRQPFMVTVRRMATGCDVSAIVFLVDASQAFDVACRHAMARLANVNGRVERNALRLVSVETLAMPRDMVRHHVDARLDAIDHARPFSIWSPGYGADRLHALRCA